MTRDSARRLLPWTLAFASPLAIHAAGAQATELHGKVVDESGAPVGGVVVMLTSVGYAVRSDSLGQFRLSGTPGSTLKFSLRAPGFRVDSGSVVLARRGAVARDFRLVSEHTPLPEANPSDRVISGRVIDVDGGPLSFANIQVNGGQRFMADDSGRFRIPISVAGRFSVLVRRIGFEPEEMKFDARPDTALQLRLKQLAVALPEQRVTGRAAFVSLDLSGFYRRMRDVERGINTGYFLTPEDFEFRKPTRITHMVQGIPTVRFDPRVGYIVGVNKCKMTIYLDRVRVVGKLGRAVDDDVDQLIVPTTIAAMEIYPRAVGAPPEYQTGNGSCGVILIWSK